MTHTCHESRDNSINLDGDYSSVSLAAMTGTCADWLHNGIVSSSPRKDSTFSQFVTLLLPFKYRITSKHKNFAACNNKFLAHASEILAGLIRVSEGGLAIAWGD